MKFVLEGSVTLLFGKLVCNKSFGGCFKYGLLNNPRHEQQQGYANQFSHNYLWRVGNYCSNRDWFTNNGLAFFIGFINRPKLVITPHLEIRQVGGGENIEEISWKMSFIVKNDGKDNAKLTRFEVSAKPSKGQTWQATPKVEGRAHPLTPPVTYRGSTTFDWFSESLQIRYSGDDYEYYVHGERTSMWKFKKGDVGVVLPLNLISGCVYGEGRLKKEFSAMLYVTGNPKEPFRLGLLSGLSEPMSQ